jgi:hypothetical protein
MRYFVPVSTAAMLAVTLTMACGGSEPAPQTAANASSSTAASTASTPAGASAGGGIRSLTVSPDSGKVDKVGGSDGALKPDGSPDIVLTADLDGPVASIFLISTGANGEPNGDYQADTITGLDQLPKDFPIAVRAGMLTAGIGIFEGDKLVTKPDGSIDLGPGPHKLNLHIAATGVLQPGTGHVRIYIARPDKTVVKGPVANL